MAIKGNGTGKVRQLSSEHDKDAKRAKQIEYRRQLELQKQEDIIRKEREQKYWKNESRPSSSDHEARPHSRPSDQPRDDPYEQPPPHQHHTDSTTSPSKSPTKARNRLVDDVYGGGGFMSNPLADVGEGWRPSKGDGMNEHKKRAILEQKKALQEQVRSLAMHL
jgi:hypothetical protein